MRPELNTEFTDLKTPEDGRVRYKEYGTKVFKIESSDPYGFWRVKPMKGSTPKEFEQEFTSVQLAEKALDKYIQRTTNG